MSYADDLTEAELTALENRIREEYKTSYYALRAKADRYFAEYEERWQEQYDAYMRGVYTEAEFHAWEETQLARGARWEALASEMAQGMTDADIVASAYINDATPSIYSLHANYTAYEIGGGVQGVSFTMYDEQTVKLLMMDENFSEFRTVKIDPVRDYEWNRSQIQKALTASILQGNDIKQMTNAFLGVMQRDENSARRNARTAFTSAQNGGRLEGMRQAVKQGIKVRKRWLSAHDGRVRDSHAMLDGQIRDIEKVFDNGCMFPSDPAGRPEEVYNCRCTLTYIYPEFDDKKSTEIYRDQALEGETYQQFVKRMKSLASYVSFSDGLSISEFEKYKALSMVTNAEAKIPYKIRQALGRVNVEISDALNECETWKKTIRLRYDATEMEVFHEYGHLIETYLVNKDDLEEYKKFLLEGFSQGMVDIKKTYMGGERYDDVIMIFGGNFEHEYQSRIYADSIPDCFYPNGSLKTELMLECTSVAYAMYMVGEPISYASRIYIERILRDFK